MLVYNFSILLNKKALKLFILIGVSVCVKFIHAHKYKEKCYILQ